MDYSVDLSRRRIPVNIDNGRPVGKRRLIREANSNFNFQGAPSRLQLCQADLSPQGNQLYHPTVFQRSNGTMRRDLEGPVPGRKEPQTDLSHSIAGQFTMSPRGIRKALRRQRGSSSSRIGEEPQNLENFTRTSGPFELSIYRAETKLLAWLNTTVHIDLPSEYDSDDEGPDEEPKVVQLSPAKMVWDVQSPHLRFACHALCRYYNVVSFSTDGLLPNDSEASSVKRLMTILRPHVSRLHPSHALTTTSRSSSKKSMRHRVKGRPRRTVGGLETPPDTGSEISSDIDTSSVCSDLISEAGEVTGEEDMQESMSTIRETMTALEDHSELDTKRARSGRRVPSLEHHRNRSISSQRSIEADVEDIDSVTAVTSTLTLDDDFDKTGQDCGLANGKADQNANTTCEALMKAQLPKQSFTEYLFLS